MTDLDIQSWPEIPTIAHFCSLFREAFGLIEFDMEQLEESLLLLGSEEDGGLVTKLIIKLLGGCLPMYKKRIKQENFSKYLVQLFQTKLEEAEEDNIHSRFENPFSRQIEKNFNTLLLRDKVIVLHQLCEYRLEAPDVGEKVKNLDASSLRVEPLGIDSEGSTLWYFYGTRLYKETATDSYRLERKRKKKHKKEKKRKRKKSSISEQETESTESDGLEAADTADSSQDGGDSTLASSWSVVCLTIQDWEELTEKYRASERKEDRRLYRLLNSSFLPEIKDMFKEKEKELKKREMENLMNTKRSSSRIETLKKTQEERDRQLALQLAEQAEKEMEERRGRKRRGRGEDAYSWIKDEEAREEREERARQREIMKEMREKRAAEKIVEERFKDDVIQQKNNLNEDEFGNTTSCTKGLFGGIQKTRKPRFRNSSSESSNSSRDTSPSSGSEDYRPSRKNGPVARASFATALLKAGTKSTKDSNLEKERGKVKDLVEERSKGPVRSVPGHLLQTAGKGLINLNKQKERRPEDDLFNPAPPTISFGLYRGHLPVDRERTSARVETEDTHFTSSITSEADKPNESTKRIFSNWGGEFFKKNLDFRANTNKILEKMQLNKSTSAATAENGTTANGGFGHST